MRKCKVITTKRCCVCKKDNEKHFISIKKIYLNIQKNIIVEFKKYFNIIDYNPNMTNTNETYFCQDCHKKIIKFNNEKIHEKSKVMPEDERRRIIEENIENKIINNNDMDYEKDDQNKGYY